MKVSNVPRKQEESVEPGISPLTEFVTPSESVGKRSGGENTEESRPHHWITVPLGPSRKVGDST